MSHSSPHVNSIYIEMKEAVRPKGEPNRLSDAASRGSGDEAGNSNVDACGDRLEFADALFQVRQLDPA